MEENQVNASNVSEEISKSKKYPSLVIFTVVVLALAIVVVSIFLRKTNKSPSTLPAQTEVTEEVLDQNFDYSEGSSTSEDVSGFVTGEESTIEVEGGKFYFNPSEIRVKIGTKVKVIFNNLEGMHDFVIDEFGVRTPVVEGGQKSEVEFVADIVGEFEYYCSVGNHRAMGMKGTLLVEE